MASTTGARSRPEKPQVQLQGARIRQVRFRAYGCPHTLAAADLVACSLEGKSVDELVKVDLDALAHRIGLPRAKQGKLLRLEDALIACHAQAQQAGQR
jgi:NifU-like protein involved in Fe-S cluster formation